MDQSRFLENRRDSLDVWRTIGASVPGTIHIKKRTPCQDAHAYAEKPGGLLIAVADGASSASYSAEAAACAVKRVIASLERDLDVEGQSMEMEYHNLMSRAFGDARVAVLSLADSKNILHRELACTLTVVLAVDGGLVTAQIGDGAAVAGTMGDHFFTIAQPQRGEYVNETFFLTGEDALDRLVIRIYKEKIRSVAVMTDGLTHLALHGDTREPYTRFFEPLVAFTSKVEDLEMGNKRLKDFLVSPRVCSRTQDDKTLVIAIRTEALV